MDLSGASSLYDQALGSIDQQKKMDMSTAANLKNLGSNLKNLGSAVGGFIKGNRAAAKAGKPGTGLFGKEGGFMSKFMTGQGWFSEAFENIGPVDTTAYKQSKTEALWGGTDAFKTHLSDEISTKKDPGFKMDSQDLGIDPVYDPDFVIDPIIFDEEFEKTLE